MKLQYYFLCKENKTKKTTLFNNLSPGAILELVTYLNNICTQISCLYSDQSVNNIYAYITLHTMFTYVILSKMVPGWRHGGDKMLNKVVIFVFFVHKKYSRSFVKLRLNQLMSRIILKMSFLHFWTLIV